MLSVVIPTLNEEANLPRILGKMRSQLSGEDEIVVVDSESRDRTVEIAKGGGARVVLRPREGIGLARTQGAREASQPFVAFLDADTIPCDNWVVKIKRALLDGATGVTGLGLYDAPRPHKDVYDSFSRAVFDSARRGYAVHGIPRLVGNNMAIDRETYLAAGGFRSVVCEDYEFGPRLALRGGRYVFDPDLTVRYSTRKFERHGFARTLAEWGVAIAATELGIAGDSRDYSAWRAHDSGSSSASSTTESKRSPSI